MNWLEPEDTTVEVVATHYTSQGDIFFYTFCCPIDFSVFKLDEYIQVFRDNLEDDIIIKGIIL